MAALRRFSVKERKLDVYFGERLVGTMAQTADRRVAFAYADEWLDSGFGISPFSLPVEQKVFVPSGQAFSGLWGVFADSLLDAWGRLLVDCMLKEKGISSADVTQLERLAIVGESGMGAMTYSPAWDTKKEETELSDLDALSAKCHAILNHEDVSNLDELFRMGGSSGGASPKIMTDDWVIKFPASGDMKDSGVMESGG
ncbi:MAG: HipA N-terminal domain-containing protein [Clostridia bacterium]|nr:HipA N-terminal domain-containing protein [Clostridia bacterium]